MTTISFTPNNNAAPPFRAVVTLDGQSYNLVTMWNFASAPESGSSPGRWYVSLRDQGGNIIVNQPLIGSPPNANIPLFPNHFTASQIVYRVATNQFEITP